PPRGALTLLPAARGDEPPTPATDTSMAAAPAAAPAPAAAAAQQAAPAAAAVSCPPSVQDRAGPDIIGLKLGMKRDEALNVVLCHNGTAEVTYEDRWLELDTHGHKLEKDRKSAV